MQQDKNAPVSKLSSNHIFFSIFNGICCAVQNSSCKFFQQMCTKSCLQISLLIKSGTSQSIFISLSQFSPVAPPSHTNVVIPLVLWNPVNHSAPPSPTYTLVSLPHPDHLGLAQACAPKSNQDTLLCHSEGCLTFPSFHRVLVPLYMYIVFALITLTKVFVMYIGKLCGFRQKSVKTESS